MQGWLVEKSHINKYHAYQNAGKLETEAALTDCLSRTRRADRNTVAKRKTPDRLSVL